MRGGVSYGVGWGGGRRGEEAGCEGRNARAEGELEGRMPEVRGGRTGEEAG